MISNFLLKQIHIEHSLLINQFYFYALEIFLMSDSNCAIKYPKYTNLSEDKYLVCAIFKI